MRRGAAMLIALGALLLAPAGANAASPVLEVVVPSDQSLPVGFTTESGEVNAFMVGFETLVHCTGSRGEGEIVGPRSAVAQFALTGCETEGGADGGRECKSVGANPHEIATGPIGAELVFIDQAKREAGILMNPGGGTYISFKCGPEAAEGSGSFLAPVTPTNEAASNFTASLSESGSMQTPDTYEGPSGEPLTAVPMGTRGSNPAAMTGVQATFAVHTSVPIEIRALTVAEVEAQQRGEEAQRLQEARKRQEALNAIKKQEEEAAARKRQEEEATGKARVASINTGPPGHKPLTRAQLLRRALRACKKEPRRRRAGCVTRAYKHYGPRAKHKREKRKELVLARLSGSPGRA
jgi:hypothetical protein